MDKLEEIARSLIANKLITSTTGPLSDRAKREMEKSGVKAYGLLKRRKGTKARFEDMGVSIGWSDKQRSWARNLTLALEEFKQEHPKWGSVLDETIVKHREVRRTYIQFEGELPEEFYMEAICNVMKGTTLREARKIYDSILIIEKRLKKERGPNRFILPE